MYCHYYICIKLIRERVVLTALISRFSSKFVPNAVASRTTPDARSTVHFSSSLFFHQGKFPPSFERVIATCFLSSFFIKCIQKGSYR